MRCTAPARKVPGKITLLVSVDGGVSYLNFPKEFEYKRAEGNCVGIVEATPLEDCFEGGQRILVKVG